MITKAMVGGVLLALLYTGCTDREAEARRAREEAEAKARAEAARKEMDALQKTFQTPDYFKKNPPRKTEPKPDPKPNTP
jgi:hypothetical protein